MAEIHPTAVVDSGAELADDVTIGPYCVVGPQVRIGPGATLKSHVVVEGCTSFGSRCMIYPFASIGARTQDKKFSGGTPRVEIGDDTTIRENVTVNAATHDGDVTRVGSNCLLMAYAHVAHDCVVGDEVIVANCGTLAGHVILEDQSILGGLTGVHQFVRVGRQSIVGGCSKVTQDIPPFMMADGHPIRVRGINRVGLERRGMNRENQRQLKAAYRILYRGKLSTSQAANSIEKELTQIPEIKHLLAFIRASERGITKR
jgi:UDP-N-acetylglucosamine acyltransferase